MLIEDASQLNGFVNTKSPEKIIYLQVRVLSFLTFHL